jgi:hypothetical protein
MEPTNILPIVAVLSLVTVEYGGWALLNFITGRQGLTDWQKGFFRAGHAHAGVLLVLTLVYLLYLPRADFSNQFEWIVGAASSSGVKGGCSTPCESRRGPVRATGRLGTTRHALVVATLPGCIAALLTRPRGAGGRGSPGRRSP